MEHLLFGAVGELSWWKYVGITIPITQCTIFSVTLYLHRSMAHGAVEFHPALAHFFRFWVWLTTGMKTKEWVAVHRKHHAKCETPDDPHSPIIFGIWRVLFFGVVLYREAAVQKSTLEYVRGPRGAMLPNDWLERGLYSHKGRNWYGIISLATVFSILFGLVGSVISLVIFYWIPFWAAGVINGAGHYWGYRNADTPDTSTNLSPLAIWVGGEELHNNHHLYPTSAKFSQKWYECDIGWGVVRVLEFFRLARVKHVSRMPVIGTKPLRSDELLRIFQHHRWLIAREFRLAVGKRKEDRRELRERFQRFLESKGVNAVNVDGFNAWIDDVARSGEDALMRFAGRLRFLRERRT